MKNGDANFNISKITIDHKDIGVEMKQHKYQSNAPIYNVNKMYN